MRKLARRLKQRLDNIVTYYTRGITNGVAESINTTIMSIKSPAIQHRAKVYRNRENFKKANFFTSGGLDLSHGNAGCTVKTGYHGAQRRIHERDLK